METAADATNESAADTGESIRFPHGRCVASFPRPEAAEELPRGSSFLRRQGKPVAAGSGRRRLEEDLDFHHALDASRPWHFASNIVRIRLRLAK
jgi:hypothetical protein